ncbi:MAG: M23 family metallopeptidase [Defluviitaleaceae bacterium]|nr:M23 family metallopeptidase [Defluviitaleaceae bacterium]
MSLRKVKPYKRVPIRRYSYKNKYAKSRKKEKLINLAVNITALVLVAILSVIIYNSLTEKRVNLAENAAYIASMRVSYNDFSTLKRLSSENNMDFPQILAYYFVENNFFRGVPTVNSEEFLQTEFLANFRRIRSAYRRSDVEPLEKMFSTLLTEVVNFPIPAGFTGYIFSDTWGAGRDYGGERIHLGTDIMDVRNIRGRIPIVSMTDGRILHMGWNELGGFHIGVVSESGTYYYYAHLYEFAQGIDVGTEVLAGDLLGFMGDTGYSIIEGTTGNFPVHLHVGIAYNAPFTEGMFWVNPYMLLRNVEH